MAFGVNNFCYFSKKFLNINQYLETFSPAIIAFKSLYSSQLQPFNTSSLSTAKSSLFVATYNSPRYSLIPLCFGSMANFEIIFSPF